MKAKIPKFPLLLIVAFIAVMLLAGCRTNDISKTEYYENGKVKAEYSDKSSGCIDWSAGNGKIMPFGNISVNGVGVTK